jgi:hypothetical protein
VMRQDASSSQHFINTLPDSFNMSLGISSANDKVISERAQGSNVQHSDIPCLLLRSKFGSQACYSLRFQKGTNLLLYYTIYGNI